MRTNDHNESRNDADEQKKNHGDGFMRQIRKIVSKMNKILKMIRECEGVLMAAYSLQCLNF